MSTVFNAAPMPYLNGINDKSRGQAVTEAEAQPTHFPHFYIYAEKGPTEPTVVGDGALASIYGIKTLDPRYPYFTHQSQFLSTTLAAGNACFVQRVIPDDAGPKSRVLISLDVLPIAIQQYQRDVSGKFVLDAAGAKIPLTGPDATKPGYRLKWVTNSWTVGSPAVSQEFGQVATRTGSMVDADSNQSTLYPLFEFEADSVGADGNNKAIRIVAPTTDSDNPLNTDAAAAVNAYLFRLYTLSRSSAELSPNIVNAQTGDTYMTFALKADAIDLTNDSDYGFNDRLIENYQALNQPGVSTPIYGPFGRQHLYAVNVQAILTLLATKEAPLGLLPSTEVDVESIYTVNPFTGVNYNNVPYYTIEVVGAADGGQRWGDNTQVYAAGGSDGTMDLEKFDLLVRNELLNYGDGEWPMLDWAKYPVSAYYDSGFELDTKYAFFIPMSKRKDVAVTVSTHIVGKPQLTSSEESSMALSLYTAAANYPESTIYGTSTVRATVVAQSGKLISSNYRQYLPLSLELCAKRAAYMGAGTGYWTSTAAYDSKPGNQLALFDVNTVNSRWVPQLTRYRDWANGMTWVQNYDRKSLFFPAVQTVYSDDTSVLNSDINMWIAVDLQKVSLRNWRDMVGNSKLTDDQFLERSDEQISEAVLGKYDNRAVIQPRTYYTSADKRRNYSWSVDINMYVGYMKTAGQFTINAYGLSALTENAG